MGHGNFGDGFTSSISGSASTASHNSLSGRSDASAHPATSVNTTVGQFGPILTAAQTDVQLALNRLSNNSVVATVSGTTFTGTVSGSLAAFSQFGDGSRALTLSGTTLTYASGGVSFLSFAADTSSDLILSAAFSTSGIQFKNVSTQIPSTTGLVRLPNSTGIFARNAANSADITVVTTDANNNVVMGDASNTANANTIAVTSITNQIGVNNQMVITAGQVQIQNTSAPANLVFSGSLSSPAASGLIRIPNNTGIYARNVANSADIPVILFDTTNRILIGNASAATTTIQPATNIVLQIGAAPQLTITAGQLLVNNSTAPANLVFSGTTSSPASAGLIRLPNNNAINARNAANTADLTLMECLSDNDLRLVTTGAFRLSSSYTSLYNVPAGKPPASIYNRGGALYVVTGNLYFCTAAGVEGKVTTTPS
jgi:hypothetical protein